MDIPSSFRGRFVLLMFCACGAVNLLFYVFLGDPLLKGKQLLFTSYPGYRSSIQTRNTSINQFAAYDLNGSDVDALHTGKYISSKHSPHAFRQLKVASQFEEKVVGTTPITNQPDVFSFPVNVETDCSDRVALIIAVISGVTNFERRHGIRHTWGSYVNNPDLNSSLVFIVGRGESHEIQSQIEKEAQLYGDIVQVDIVDSYRNLTLKSVAVLQWIVDYCSKSKFALKTDDDMFINVPNLINSLTAATEKRFIMGYIFKKVAPVRNRNSKWVTSVAEYGGKFFPTYASGTAYAFPTPVAKELREASIQTRLFWLEDVYVTGMCARKANVQHVHNSAFWYTKRKATGCEYVSAISGHEVTLTQMSKIFSELMASPSDCDNKQGS